MAKMRVFLDFITPDDGKYILEGYTEGISNLKDCFVTINDSKYELTPTERKILEGTDKHAFITTIDISNDAKQKIAFIKNDEGSHTKVRIKTGPYTRLASLLGAYRVDSDVLFTKYPRHITVRPYTKSRHIVSEILFLLRLLFFWQLRHAVTRLVLKYRKGEISLSKPLSIVKEAIRSVGVIVEAIIMIPRAYILRIRYYVAKKRKKRPIWMVSDRAIAGGDNGEALFRYICGQDCPADVYFVISKKTDIFHKLSKIGNVLDPSSFKYKLKFLMADKVISSQADIPVFNPFVRQIDHFMDLYNFDFIFLQHGVIRHDLSDWLNRYNRNIRLFITTGKKEYDSILNNAYYYTKREVLLSGQPRYDLLENHPNRKLILSPTYRGNLLRHGSDKKGQRPYDTHFKTSEYRNFYNNLMNDPRIVKELKNQNMTGEFYLHPVFAAQRQDFDENEVFRTMHFPYDYKSAFREGELLISDHSSVVFDFVYLKKPTVYAHFDIDTFFTGHSYSKSNFFSDVDDGFGEVFYDYETLVGGVLKLLQNGRKMSEKYQKRVDNFFYKVDKNNSKRVYDAILALK